MDEERYETEITDAEAQLTDDTEQPSQNEPESDSNDISQYEPKDFVFDEIKEYSPGFRGRMQRIRDRICPSKYLGLCFLIPFGLMLIIYFALGVWPISNNSVLVLDLNAQYVSFIEKFRSILSDGGSFLYSFQRALGGEFMGIFAYYLASPFNLITLLFPKSGMTEALLLIMTLKCGLCGYTFGFYLHKTRKTVSKTGVVIFSTLFALCSFAVVMQHNLMWTDNIFLFPLILLGIEELIKHGKFKMYVICLAYAILSNFYIGYMACIFSLIYYLVKYCVYTKEEKNPLGVKHHFIKTSLKFALYSVVAAAIAAIIILPTFYSLQFGKLEFTTPNFEPKQIYNFTDIFSTFYFGTYDSVKPEGLPFLYCGMLPLLLMPLYFFLKKEPMRKKIGNAVLLAIFALSFNFTVLNLIWHGLQKPNWLNARYTYMFVAVFLVMAYEVFVSLREIGVKKVALSGLAMIGILLFLEKSGIDHLDALSVVWPSLLIIVVYVAALKFVKKDLELSKTGAASIVLCVLICIELVASSVICLYKFDDEVKYTSRTTYRTHIDKYREAVALTENDTTFFRSEKLEHRKSNDNFALGINGLSNSTSTLNASVIRLLKNFGFTSRSHWSKYVGGTITSDIFFGIKYLYIDPAKDDVPWYVAEYYDLVGETKDGVQVYRNPYAFSIGFASDEAMAVYGTDDSVTKNSDFSNPFDFMNNMFGMIYPEEKENKIWERITISGSDYSGCKKGSVQDDHTSYTKNSEDSPADVSFDIIAPSDDPIYMYFPSTWTGKCKLKVNGESKGEYFTNDTIAIKELGCFEKGEEIHIKFELQENKVYMKNLPSYFFSFSKANFEKMVNENENPCLTVTEHSETDLKGRFTAKEDNTYYVTTIPYDEGWDIIIDGKSIDYESTLGSIIAFRADKGEHTFEFRYSPICFRNGLIITIAGLIIFGELCFSEYRKKKKPVSAGGGEEVPEDISENPTQTEDDSEFPDETDNTETNGESENDIHT